MTLLAVLKAWSAEETLMLAPHVRKRDAPLGRWGPVVLYTVNWALWLLTGLWAGAWERLWLAALSLPALGLYLWRTRRSWR
jgi:hypothetical protein